MNNTHKFKIGDLVVVTASKEALRLHGITGEDVTGKIASVTAVVPLRTELHGGGWYWYFRDDMVMPASKLTQIVFQSLRKESNK